MSTVPHLTKKAWHIFSIILSAIMIASFLAPISTMRAYALDIPQPIYPANYANTTPATDPPLGVPSFSWTSVAGANIYRLQVDNEIGFNSPIVLDITTRNTSFTPASTGHLFFDGDWYWRVRVDDPQPVGQWSLIRHFTKTWATLDNDPSLVSPAIDQHLAFFDSPVFSWTPVMGAARYRFQIATSYNGFDVPAVSVDTLSTTYQHNNRLANGEYFWRVIPMDTVDHLGTFSEIRRFYMSYGTYATDQVPTLLEPLDDLDPGYTPPKFTPTFRWTAVEGAQSYRLEYTSDETCDFSLGTSLYTRQTSYTPTDTFPNDFRYCWHVRVESGPAVGDWSDTWHFMKIWDYKPVLLTPTNNYQIDLNPLFSWTPVPGASRYQIQISIDHFSHIYEESITANPFYTLQNYLGNQQYWWRVRPIDGGGEFGALSDEASFISYSQSEAPVLVYPLYYYIPNNYAGLNLNPHENRTVAFPIFIWHRVLLPSPIGGVFANAYRIQVDVNPNFLAPVWQYDTENTSASPTLADNFLPSDPNVDYYWRVCPLNNLGGDCLPELGAKWWSQKWRTRFDSSLMLTPTTGLGPQLIRPEVGQESVEATPLLEWWPFEGAVNYLVQISDEPDFLSPIISDTVEIPAYSPPTSLAQRSLDRIDYGTFYWRVQALTGNGLSQWSDTWRFQIASQSEWRYTRNLGEIGNRLLIATDPISDTTPIYYDLSTLYASQDSDSWFISFNANISPTNMTYLLYLDLDNVDGSGANVPPDVNMDVATIPAHQPEYAVEVDDINGVIDIQDTWVYAWNSTGHFWEYPRNFEEIGASLQVSAGLIELEIPDTAIGMSQQTNSASVILTSMNTYGELKDSVPSDPAVPGSGVVIMSRFSAVSEHMNLIFPPNTAGGDPATFTSLQPFFWDWPTGSNDATPFAGFVLNVDLDQNYSPPHEATYTGISNTSYFGENQVAPSSDIVGDNIYYWRVQPRYLALGHGEAFGAWTGGWSFRRLGFTPQNLSTSVNFATPTFRWDMAEGADTYHLQVATDQNFGNRVIDINTPLTSFTPQDTLAQGLYYWRVQINRSPNIGNDWSLGPTLNLVLPTPVGLTPDANQLVHYTPTYCWTPLVGYDNDQHKVLTAWRYHIQVSQDSNFSTTYDSVDTYNNCWTPTFGYQDGAYYWHVAMVDGNSRMGAYSATATFIKQYPITTLISPIDGVVPNTPTFVWTPVDGAATYLFEVSLFQTFYPLYDQVETINTQYTPVITYATDRTYFWRVAIRDRSGRLGPYSDAIILIGKAKTFLPILVR